MSVPTNFVLQRHAQRTQVIDLRLKSFDASDSFMKLNFDCINVSLSHL